MAFSTTSLASFFLIFLILHLVHAGVENTNFEPAASTQGGRRSVLATIDCNGECSRRCGLASRRKLCLRACGSCCSRCRCVPPGTSGNKEQCPCYNSLTTHGGRKKCP